MISKETIALVRDRTDIIAVVSESVPSLKKRGRRFLGLCPFHKEKTPSFNVNPDTGLYHCFGCKESGDAIRFLEKVEGYPFAEAVRALAERAGVPIEEERGAAPSEAERHKKERAALYAAMQMAATWYEEQLREHPLASLRHRRARAPRARARRRGRAGISRRLRPRRVGRARVVLQEAGRLARRGRERGPARAPIERLRVLRPLPAPPHVSRARRARAGRRLQRPRASSSAAGEVASGSPADPPPKYINSPESPIYVKGANALRPLAGSPRDPPAGKGDSGRGKLRCGEPARPRASRTWSRRSAPRSRSTRRSCCVGTPRA